MQGVFQLVCENHRILHKMRKPQPEAGNLQGIFREVNLGLRQKGPRFLGCQVPPSMGSIKDSPPASERLFVPFRPPISPVLW